MCYNSTVRRSPDPVGDRPDEDDMSRERRH